MSQIKTFTWTNPSSTVGPKLINLNFQVARVEVFDQTSYGSTTSGTLVSAHWNNSMPAGSAFLSSATGKSYITSNGFTPMQQAVRTGASISGFSNANPATVQVDDATAFNTGDVIKVVGVADSFPSGNSTASSLNGTYTVASISGNTLTLNVDSTGFKTYVAGGFVSIITKLINGNNTPWPLVNTSVGGILLGSSVVGASSDTLHLIAFGDNPVT